MNAALAWSNLVAYSLQIGLLVAVASVVPGMLKMRLPKVKLLYWQVLLAACLVLPQTRPWQQTVVTLTMATPAPHPTVLKTQHSKLPPANPWTAAEVALFLLGAGAIGRLGWLCAGFWRLRRFRNHSTPWYGDTAHFGERRPEYRISDDIGSPVTFGVSNPVILLPRKFLDLSPQMQAAILCHETLHVERRDWVFTVAEELVRSVFWFHPAIWWLLGEIQLAREQAVDREVVERTQARDAYVDALLAVAGARLETDLALAPLFLRKRHLKQRVMTIVKETGMSKLRALAAMAVGLAMLAASGWFVTMVFPLAAAPQTIMDAAGVTVDLGGAQLLHRPPISYPAEAARKRVQGRVVVQVKLANDGTVTDASVLTGPDELRKSVLQSVLDWHFNPSAGGTMRQISVDFQAPEGSQAPVVAAPPRSTVGVTLPRDGNLGKLPQSTVSNIEIRGLSEDAADQLRASLPVRVGDVLTADLLAQTEAAVHTFDAHLNFSRHVNMATGEQTLTIVAPGPMSGTLREMVTTTAPAPPPKPQADTAPNAPRRVVISGNVQAAMLIYGPMPEYPALAKQARVQGVVHLHAYISKEGYVQSLAVIPPAHPLLAPAAVEAVRRWQYKPTLLNGEPVAVETTVDVSFMLEQ